MNNLMLHCGAHSIERGELEILPLPEPRGARHRPVAFSKYIDMVENTLATHGYAVNEQAYGVTADHNRFFGLMQLQATTPNADYTVMLGLRGSHDQRLPRGITIGNRVLVCDNLMFTGDYTLQTKQTTNIMQRLPGLVERTVAQLPVAIDAQDKFLQMTKAYEVAELEAEHYIVEAVRREVIMPSQLGKVIEGWDHLREDYLTPAGKTLWGLMNVITEVLKPSENRGNVPLMTQRTLRLSHMLGEAV